ncbi:hypothetical protein N7478_010181 [Penicillium angulare]|uniref:uncharacterized protein n=1 Tax=Penicillium angulare TaxID=116970 RepID=UPI00254133D9|nr:uncharacterized protein N7478_010181 [Penicillium angulare]KAJ5267373.1 hypothetical protein N7478_010181 [Penicillium angulare]
MLKVQLCLISLFLCSATFIALTVADAEGSYLWERTQTNETNNYVRVIELQHAGNFSGRLLGTWEHHYTHGPQTITPDGTPGNFIIRKSDDKGLTWETLATVHDTRTASGYPFAVFYQPFLFEYPQQLGKYPQGTILLVGNLLPANCSEFAGEFFAWRSKDHGKTWDSVGVWQRATRNGGIWEPFLYLDNRGRLIAVFSDERDHESHSQMLVHVVSDDGGDSWGEPIGAVVSSDQLDRPGMATVTKMGNGEYIMSYEFCFNYCRAHYKTSKDGFDWDARDVGTAISTADGLYPAQSPYIVWDSSTQKLALASQVVRYFSDNNTAEQQNRIIFTNTNQGIGFWSWSPSPWTVGLGASGCANYSPHLIPMGKGIIRYTAPSTENESQFCSERTGAAPVAVLPYEANFSSEGQAGWIDFSGNWTVLDGEYRFAQVDGKEAIAVTGSSAWNDYIISADVMVTGSDSSVGLYARVSAAATGLNKLKGYTATINTTSGELGIWQHDESLRVLHSEVHTEGISSNQWYQLSLIVNSTEITATLGKAQSEPKTSFTVTATDFGEGMAGLFGRNGGGRFKNVEIAA